MPSELKRETRAIHQAASIGTHKRADGTETKCVEGYGIVFYNATDAGTEYRMFDDLVERVDPASVNRSIAAGVACRCFVNHNPDNMLGRCDKGTMRLSVDQRGCKYSCDLPNTQVGRDTEENLTNGNLDGSSFSFEIIGQRWEDIKREDGSILTIRTITDMNLFEMGPVNFPAYEATTAGLGGKESPESIRQQRDDWRNGLKRAAEAQAEAIAIRSKMQKSENALLTSSAR